MHIDWITRRFPFSILRRSCLQIIINYRSQLNVFLSQDSFDFALFIISSFSTCILWRVKLGAYVCMQLQIWQCISPLGVQLIRKTHTDRFTPIDISVLVSTCIINYKWHTLMYIEKNYMHLSKTRLTIWTYVQILNSCL